MISGLLATCGPTYAHHHAVGSWEILFAINFFTVALVFDPRKRSHPAPTSQEETATLLTVHVAYTFQTHIHFSLDLQQSCLIK